VPITVVGRPWSRQAFHPARSARNHLRVFCTAAGLPMSRDSEGTRQIGHHVVEIGRGLIQLHSRTGAAAGGADPFTVTRDVAGA
jgi:hypothetical protein